MIRVPALYSTGFALSLLVLSGCTMDNPVYQPGPILPGECRAGAETSETFSGFELPGKVDLLFVVPDTPGEETQSFQQALLPGLFDLLGDATGELDLRVAVISPGNPRSGLATPNQEVQGCGAYARDEETPPIFYPGVSDWTERLECTLLQGAQGNRRPQVLESLVRGYDDGFLEDFLRPDARQIAIVAAHEDDCSGVDFEDDGASSFRDLCAWQAGGLADVETAVERLRRTASAPEGFRLVVLGGPPTGQQAAVGEVLVPSCTSALGSVYPTPRLFQATRLLGDQGFFLNACATDFQDLLVEVFQRTVWDDGITLCPSLPVAQEPLEVLGFTPNDDRDLIFGDEFTFSPTTLCPEGAIRLHRGVGELEEVRLRYCAL